MTTPLDPLSFPLHGSRLIEASAGTGKTWTIAALYLRLVLGHGAQGEGDERAGPGRALLPRDILVMTFTRAATRELRQRIRDLLVQAASFFRAPDDDDAADDFLHQLRAAYPPGAPRARAAWLLDGAASCMDEAAIHTMDAWCQRTVREHALDGGWAQERLLEDEARCLRDATHDYWRQHCCRLPDPLLAQVLDIWPGTEPLLQDAGRLLAVAGHAPGSAGLAAIRLEQCMTQAQEARQQALTSLAQGWQQKARHMQQWLDAQLETRGELWNKKKLAPKHYNKWCEAIAAWAKTPQALDLHQALSQSARQRLSLLGLADAFLGPPESLDALEPLPEFSQLQTLLEQLAQLPTLRSAVRLHACAAIGARMAWIKRQAGSFSHADMLQRLLAALEEPRQGQILRARLLEQYPVALIDEFQDTSPQQYRLFEHIYRTADNDPASALLLIGDPKQSIYGFRDADIYSYLHARAATEGRHYVLETNHRSSSALVEVLNQLFGQAEARQQEDGDSGYSGAFLFRSPDGRNPLPFVPVRARGRLESLRATASAPPAAPTAPPPACDGAPPAPPAAHKSPG